MCLSKAKNLYEREKKIVRFVEVPKTVSILVAMMAVLWIITVFAFVICAVLWVMCLNRTKSFDPLESSEGVPLISVGECQNYFIACAVFVFAQLIPLAVFFSVRARFVGEEVIDGLAPA